MVHSVMFPALLAIPLLAATAGHQLPTNAKQSERKLILDAMRVPLERSLKGPVEFVVVTYRRAPVWAFVQAEPHRPGGKLIDGRRYYGDDWLNMDGLTTTAILHKVAGRWKIVELRVGATDAWYCGFVPTKQFDPCDGYPE
jgi:hypothetical protein